MSSNSNCATPSIYVRITNVWYRHYRVYTKNLISNGLPPFLEPLIFLAGIGLGMGRYIDEMNGIPYIRFLATGLPVTAAMYTAAFECSFGTFIRLEYDKAYDGMLAAPITVKDMLLGEILWAGTKGMFFATAVIIMSGFFGLIPAPSIIGAPVVGFFTGIMFAALSLWVTSFVTNINHFNFYMTGFISPMFFFSGVVFPLENLPTFIRPFAELFPLTHAVRIMRSISFLDLSWVIPMDILFIIAFTIILTCFAVQRLSRRLIV